MGITPNFSLPYPEVTDTVDVPRDVRALAYKLDDVIPTGGGGGGGGGVWVRQHPVLDVGLAGQIRAGRQLASGDFTTMGLSPPLGLWNLSDTADASGNNRALTNKGGVPFGPGINGGAVTCAVFAGSTGQALYIVDSGAADPFRIRTGSWGCWFRTAKRDTDQYLIAKSQSSAAQAVFWLSVAATNQVYVQASTSGGADLSLITQSDSADDRWHFAVATADGATLRAYVDGALEAVANCGVLFSGSGPLNIGGYGADAATATATPFYGRVDEAFITADVLSEDQVRGLYCAKLGHGLGDLPARFDLNVRRRRRGGTFAVSDFPAPPLRLHNFTGGALGDEGSGGVALTTNPGTGSIVAVAGADGSIGNGYSLSGAHTGLSSTDAGLPAGLAARSYGLWVKTATAAAAGVIAWGPTTSGAGDCNIWTGADGHANASNGADNIAGPFLADGQWHFCVVVEDTTAGDGVRRKFYLDGRLVGGSTAMNPVTLGGATNFRVGVLFDGAAWHPLTGQVDGVFVCGYTLTFEQIAALYAKGTQELAPSPKNAGDHVEAADAIGVYLTFDTLGAQDTVDVGVAV